MTLSRFLSSREATWRELEALLRGPVGPGELGSDGVVRLGALYRAAASDLALARRRFPGDPVLARLEHLVGKARGAIYAAPERGSSAKQFVTTGYWCLVAERPRVLALAWAILLGFAALAALWALRDPDAATRGLVPGQFRGAVDPANGRQVLSADQTAAFTTQLFTHNIQVTFLALAAGLTAGIGTAILLAYNGAILGAIGGVLAGGGDWEAFVRLVAAHGFLELSCVVVTSVAGLRLGWALVRPGYDRRAVALRREALAAVGIVLGTMPWLVVAGIVEAGVTPVLGVPMQFVVGLALAALYWALVAWRGRGRGARVDLEHLDHSRASAFNVR